MRIRRATDATRVPTTRTLTINGVAQDLSADRTWTVAGATAVLVGPQNLVSTVEVIAANTYVHVGRQLEITSTGSIEIPATSTLEITA